MSKINGTGRRRTSIRIAALLASVCLAAGAQALVPAWAGAETNMGEDCGLATVAIDCSVADADDDSGITGGSDSTGGSDPGSGADPGSGDSGTSGTSGTSGSGGITYVRGISPNPKDYGGLPHDGGDKSGDSWGDDSGDSGDGGASSGSTGGSGGGIIVPPDPIRVQQESPKAPCYWAYRAIRQLNLGESAEVLLDILWRCRARHPDYYPNGYAGPRLRKPTARLERQRRTVRGAKTRHVSHGGGSIR